MTRPPPLIEVHDLHYRYMRGTPLEREALRGVDFDLYPGEVVGVIGPTGSGKSTLLQHLNGLLRPQAGTVRVAGQDLSDPECDLRALRLRVALLFQNAGDQLFEAYLADDVAFGPLNMGLPQDEVRRRVCRAMEAAGLPLETYRDRLTFSLSGGERRRAGLAGVLALDPQVLVLDEPLAGLDPQGCRDLLGLIQSWQQRENRAIVWTSHSMEEIAQLAQRIYVLAEGRVVLQGPPRQVFQDARLCEYDLEPPLVTQVLGELRRAGYPVSGDALTLEEAADALQELLP
ncbi:MAG: energy-coupling factor transporter ATPase [Chloroflexia bacterium]|nr:energy-coupling factor transporter ATPase [Chloroflexia bacterium]